MSALRARGWTISQIARHIGERNTIRAYLAGDRTPGVRKRHMPDPYEPFVEYVTARIAEDPHLWAQTLMGELESLGFPLSYQSRLAAEPYQSRRHMSCEYDYFDTVK